MPKFIPDKGKGFSKTGSGRFVPDTPRRRPAPKPKKKSDGGFLHGLKEVVSPGHGLINKSGRKGAALVAKDLYTVGTSLPGGLYATGKTVGTDLNRATGKGGLINHRDGGDFSFKGSRKLGAEMAKSTLEDIKHPLRHPGYTALDLLGLASAGAGAGVRVAAGAKAAKAASTVSKTARVGAAAKAAAKRPIPQPRAVTFKGQTVKKPASASPVVRAAQVSLDRLGESFPDTPLIGAANVVKHNIAKTNRFAGDQAKAPHGEFTQAAKQAGMLKRVKVKGKVGGLTREAQAKQHALRVVAEGVSPTERATFHGAQLAKGYKASARKNPEIAALRQSDYEKGHAEQIRLNQDASKYVVVRDGKPTLRDPKMRAAYDAMGRVSEGREEIMGRLGKLTEETMAGRLSKPGQVLTANPDFTGGEIRVKTVPKYKQKGVAAPTPGQGSAGLVNTPQTPGSIKHPYTGAAYRAGNIRNDVVRLQNESGLEAQRYYTLVTNHDRLKNLGTPQPTDLKHDIAVRIDQLPDQPTANELRTRLENAHDDAVAEFSHGYEGLRQTIFPDISAEAGAQMGNIPGVVWVDKRLLGGLNERNPLIGVTDYKIGRSLLAVNDAVNNATKLAMLYLKPAYVAPNLLGNVAMNLVQQGVFAPMNLGHAAKLNASVGLRIANKVDAAMGEGLTSSLHSEAGIASKATHTAANVWGKAVDKYPRRAAFLHEARRHGYGTPEKLTQLFDNPKNAQALEQVTKRANDAIIDYADLNRAEQALVRRVVFFYPWVKGATKWSVHFVSEHPVQATVATQLAQKGKADQQAVFGDEVPAWGAGLIPVGGGRTVNPSSISVLSTPADVGTQLAGMFPGFGSPSNDIGGQLTPALSVGRDILNGGDFSETERTARNLPIVRLLGGAPPSKSFPQDDARTKALLYLLGSGIVPRKTDPAALRASYEAQFRR